MSASVVKRGSRYYVVDEQGEPARRCTQCRPKPRGRSTRTPRGGSRYWVSDLDGAETCPACGAPLGPAALERRQRSGGTFKLRREADAAAAELDVSKQRGAYVAPSKVTVGEYLTERWLPAVEHTVKPSTFNSYRAEVDLHLIPKLGHVRLRDLGPEHLNRLYGELLP